MNILPKINGWNNNSFAEQLFIIAVVGIFFWFILFYYIHSFILCVFISCWNFRVYVVRIMAIYCNIYNFKLRI